MFSTKYSLEKNIKIIGHHARLRDVTDKSSPIYACTRANRVHRSKLYFTVAGCIVY